MGFTPTGGFMMGTRSGDLDPGVLLYLLTHAGYDAAALEQLVDHEAGLLGVSGIGADMKTLLAVRAREPAAAEAVALFCHQLWKHVGALAAVLGGLDTLVFTGGIGEHAAPVRAEACRGLEHLGVRLDPERNARHAAVISADGPGCTVRVIATDEDLVIARHTRAVLAR
jgi:acetate kinase